MVTSKNVNIPVLHKVDPQEHWLNLFKVQLINFDSCV